MRSALVYRRCCVIERPASSSYSPAGAVPEEGAHGSRENYTSRSVEHPVGPTLRRAPGRRLAVLVIAALVGALATVAIAAWTATDEPAGQSAAASASADPLPGRPPLLVLPLPETAALTGEPRPGQVLDGRAARLAGQRRRLRQRQHQERRAPRQRVGARARGGRLAGRLVGRRPGRDGDGGQRAHEGGDHQDGQPAAGRAPECRTDRMLHGARGYQREPCAPSGTAPAGE